MVIGGKPQDTARGSNMKCFKGLKGPDVTVSAMNAQPGLIFYHLSRPSRKEVIFHS